MHSRNRGESYEAEEDQLISNSNTNRYNETLPSFVEEYAISHGYSIQQFLIKSTDYQYECSVKDTYANEMKIRCLFISNMNPRIERLFEQYCREIESKNFKFMYRYIHRYIEGNFYMTVRQNYPTLYDVIIIRKQYDLYMTKLTSIVNIMHHNGIIYTNLNPKNIYVNEDDGSLLLGGYGEHLLVLNEIEKYYNGNDIQYFAPEVLYEEEYDEKVDIWSLACLLYFIETRGLTPFEGERTEEIVDNMKKGNYRKDKYDDLYNHCFSSDSKDRYESFKFENECLKIYNLDKYGIYDKLSKYRDNNDHVLSFDHIWLNMANVNVIASAFYNLKDLEVLDLTKTEIDDKSLSQFCACFNGVPCLRELNLYWNHITDNGLIYLCKYLNVISKLECLDISRNYVHDIGAAELFKTLRNTSITKLFLERNYIYGKSIDDLCKYEAYRLEILRLSSIYYYYYYY